MKRRIVITTLALCLSLGCLTACGENHDEIETTVSTEVETEESTETTTEETAETETEDVSAYESSEYTFEEMSQTMICNIETAPVYVKPNENSSIFTFIKKDNTVDVTSKCNEADYYGINVNGETGYIKVEYLSEYVEPTETESETSSEESSSQTPSETEIHEEQSSTPVESSSNTNNSNSNTSSSSNSSSRNNTQSSSSTTSTAAVSPTVTVDGFKYALYTPYTFDENSAYFYYVIGEESYTPYRNTISTLQTNLNAQKYPYWQVTALGSIGTYSNKQIGVALCETFSSADDYSTNKTTRATKAAGTQSIWQ